MGRERIMPIMERVKFRSHYSHYDHLAIRYVIDRVFQMEQFGELGRAAAWYNIDPAIEKLDIYIVTRSHNCSSY